MNSRFLRNGIVTLVLVVGTIALVWMFLFPSNQADTIPYSGGRDSFLGRAKAGQVTEVIKNAETQVWLLIRRLTRSGRTS